MKKLALLLLAAAFVFAFGGIALAGVHGDHHGKSGVEITTHVNTHKDVDVDVHKNVDIDVHVDPGTLGRSAEADSTLSQGHGAALVIQGNLFDPGQANSDAQIEGSIYDQEGVTQFNQDSGNGNNQANSTAISIIKEDEAGYADAKSGGQQVNDGGDNSIKLDLGAALNLGTTLGLDFPASGVAELGTSTSATIVDAIDHNKGIINVNQSAGNLNSQVNQISMGLLKDANVALAEADLGQVTSNYTVVQVNTTSTAQIVHALHDNQGVVNVNQSSGNLANQANVFSLAADIGMHH
ncbi:MAG: hypothetical protein M0Z75_14390 [Nitrospiraceae bacterium]|nr:hypothetical protein [Nitrospiraceae bacterium]